MILQPLTKQGNKEVIDTNTTVSQSNIRVLPPLTKAAVEKPKTPVQKTTQLLNTPPKTNTTFKLNSAVKLNLVDPQQASSAKMTVTKKSLQQDAKSIKQMDAIGQKITQILPQTSKNFNDLFKDPLSLKVSPGKAVNDAIEAVKEPLKQEKARIIDYFNSYGKKPPSLVGFSGMTDTKKIGKQLEVISGAAGVVFSPISALFAAAKDIPVLGTVARAIETPFSLAGESASALSGKLVDVLPIPEADKKNVKKGVQEISALAAQLLLGKASAGEKGITEISPAKRADLVNKYGLQDALTIETKAKQVATNQEKAIHEGKTYTPDEIINKVIGSPLENTPEGKSLVQAALEAQKTNKSIEISQTPTVEKLGKDTALYRGAKDQTIDVTRPNGITGGVSFSTDKVVADRFAQKEGGTVKSYTISKDATIVNHSALEGMSEAERNKFIKDYKIDAVKFDIPKGAQGEAEIRVLNNQVLRTASETPTPKTPSKIGLSIERKAVEAGITKAFDGVAGYDKITIADQAKRATDLVTKDFEKARRVVRGEEDLPSGLRGGALIKAMEEHIKKTGNAEIAHELANSKLISQTSAAAQELRLAAEREPDSLAVRLSQLRQAREEGIKKRTGKTVDKAIKAEVDRIKVEIKKKVPKREDWKGFIDSIEC